MDLDEGELIALEGILERGVSQQTLCSLSTEDLSRLVMLFQVWTAVLDLAVEARKAAGGVFDLAE